MRTQLILLLASIFFMALACHPVEDNMNNTTYVILLDLSGMENTTATRATYAENAGKIIQKAGAGDVITVAVITQSSITEPELIVNQQLPPFKATTDNTMVVEAEKALHQETIINIKDSLVERVQSFLNTNERIAQSTDIIGAIHQAGLIFNKYPNPVKNLVFLSDMEEYSSSYKFPLDNLTEERIMNIIEEERKSARGLPDLSGVNVYAIGAHSRNQETFFRIRNFWIAYFNETGASLTTENYGAAFIDF